MIITINNETLPHEMHHIAVALQRIAVEQGYVAPVDVHTSASQTSTVGEMSVTLNVDTTNATSAVEALAELIDRTGVKVEDVPPVTYSVESTPINTDHASIDDAGNVTVVMEPIAPPVITNSQLAATITNDNLDSAGLPWDARIHAGSRERNTDGSWRVRRRPKGVEEAEWEATLARVTSELRDLMEIPVSTGAVADAAAEEREIGDVHHTAHALTDAEVDAFVDIVQGVTVDDVVVTVGDVVIEGYADGAKVTIAPPPVTIAPPVVVAPPAIEPPVAAVAPPITTDAPKVETFAQVMTFLTARTPKDEAAKPAMVAKVNEILAANGLTVLTQLGQRPELIPQVMTQFTEAFGE